MAFFKKMTSGKTVVMGKNTYLSLPEKFRPLPNRTNIVISSLVPIEQKENLMWARSIDDALQKAKDLNTDEIYVIGGGQIYKSLLSITDCIYATEVDVEIEGDTFFPELNPVDWTSETIESFEKYERNEYGFKIVKYWRK